jgi:Phospholipase D-like domain at C-terminus of MIT
MLNSATERTRLAAYGMESQRYCGSNPSAWLQRKYRTSGGGLLTICSGVDDSDVNQATPWTEFLVTYAKEHPGAQIELGLTQLPSLTDITEHNFLAVKALLDLMAAGIRLFHVPHAPPGGWHMVLGSAGEEPLAMVTLDAFPALSTKLDTQPLVYNSASEVCQAARDAIQATLQKGRPITAATLSAPKQATYRVVDIEDGERGVTYEKLFGQYLADAQRLRIVDPYVRLEYQVRNIETLLHVLTTPHGCEVELLTMFDSTVVFWPA